MAEFKTYEKVIEDASLILTDPTILTLLGVNLALVIYLYLIQPFIHRSTRK